MANSISGVHIVERGVKFETSGGVAEKVRNVLGIYRDETSSRSRRLYVDMIEASKKILST